MSCLQDSPAPDIFSSTSPCRSRKKRAAGSPDSARSDHVVGDTAVPGSRAKNARGHSNQSPAVHDSATPTDTATVLGRGRRVRKDKEPSLELDGEYTGSWSPRRLLTMLDSVCSR